MLGLSFERYPFDSAKNSEKTENSTVYQGFVHIVCICITLMKLSMGGWAYFSSQPPLLLPQLSLLAEEFAEEFGTGFCEDAGADFATMVETWVVEQLKK